MKTKISLTLASGILLLISFGCAESSEIENRKIESSEIDCCAQSATLDDLKFGTKKELGTTKTESKAFSPEDEIYIFSRVKYTPAVHKVRVVLFYEDVQGEEPNSIAIDYGELETVGESDFSCRVSSKTGSLSPGRYRAEAVLSNYSNSREIYRKAGTFDVANN